MFYTSVVGHDCRLKNAGSSLEKMASGLIITFHVYLCIYEALVDVSSYPCHEHWHTLKPYQMLAFGSDAANSLVSPIPLWSPKKVLFCSKTIWNVDLSVCLKIRQIQEKSALLLNSVDVWIQQWTALIDDGVLKYSWAHVMISITDLSRVVRQQYPRDWRSCAFRSFSFHCKI